MFPKIGKIVRIVAAWARGLKCEECKSRNIKFEKWEPVDPQCVKDAYFIAAGYSAAAGLGWKSARGNYKKKDDLHTIYQTRDLYFHCQDCDHKFTVRGEKVIASDW